MTYLTRFRNFQLIRALDRSLIIFWRSIMTNKRVKHKGIKCCIGVFIALMICVPGWNGVVLADNQSLAGTQSSVAAEIAGSQSSASSGMTGTQSSVASGISASAPLSNSTSSLSSHANSLTTEDGTKGTKLLVNGTPVPLSVAPMIVNGRFQVEMQPLFNALGAGSPQWDQQTKTITENMGNTSIRLSIGSTTGYIDGKPFSLDSPPVLFYDKTGKDWHTLIPVRFVSEAFCYDVNYDVADQQIDITSLKP